MNKITPVDRAAPHGSQKVLPNRRRGEILMHIDDTPKIMCLTLGALAELEDAFKVENLSELGIYFSNGKFSADDLVHIIGAGLRGGGNLYTDEDVRCLSIEGGAVGLAQIAAELLKITFSSGQNEENDQHDTKEQSVKKSTP